MKVFWQFLIALILPISSHQKSDPSSETYTGAIVKYSPVYHDKDNKHNIENYVKFIEKAAEFGADVIVFPEQSLSIPYDDREPNARIDATSYIPDPQEEKVPCGDEYYALTLQGISCAAKKYEIYVVVNHQEKVDCTEDCPKDGYTVYNTNVAFDRNGVVIARYRKYNLFFEFGTNTTSVPIPSSFKTDFGVTFGQFVCFDIMFQSPALNLTKDYGITDILYSTHWFSIMPFFFSFEYQAAWAYANDVNLLAAPHNNQQSGSGGAGIYIGRKGYISADPYHYPANVLTVAEIPKFINGQRSRNINQGSLRVHIFEDSEIGSTVPVDEPGNLPYTTVDIKQWTTELIYFEQSVIEKTVCDHNICCQFQLEVNRNENDINPDSNYYRYRFAAFDGTMSLVGAASAGAKICGIISCTNDTVESCGKLHDNNKPASFPINFENINIEMPGMSSKDVLLMPVTLAKSMMPLNATEFSFSQKSIDENFYNNLKLTQPRKDLLTFSILGRNFKQDGTQPTPDT